MSERRHFLVLGVTIFAVLLFGLFVLRPRASHANELRAQLTEARAEGASIQAHLDTLLQASLQREDFEAEAQQVENLLPRFPHLVRTFRLLHRAAVKSGVDLREIAPSMPSPNLTLPAAKTITTTLIVEGSYDRLEAFVNRLEQLERAMQVTAYSYTPSQQGNRTILSGALTAEMYLFDADAAGSAPPAAAPNADPATEVTP